MASSPFKPWLTSLPLAREKFYVVRHDRKWKVRHKERFYGPYLIPGEAVRVAVQKAHEAGREGSSAQVFVQEGQEFRLQWTYGLDPYPAQL